MKPIIFEILNVPNNNKRTTSKRPFDRSSVPFLSMNRALFLLLGCRRGSREGIINSEYPHQTTKIGSIFGT